MEYVVIKLTCDGTWVEHTEGPFESFDDAAAYAKEQGYRHGQYCLCSIKAPNISKTSHTVTNGVYRVTVTRADGRPFSKDGLDGALKYAPEYDYQA
jgi:hypothetical protein